MTPKRLYGYRSGPAEFDAGVIVYGGPQAKSFGHTLRDLVEGLRCYEFWHTFAWNDIKARYRRSWLGEFWMVISLAVFVISVGTVYGFLLNVPLSNYLPRLTIGYAFWLLFSTLAVDGCQTFIAGSNALRQQRMPLTAFVLRNVDRAFLMLAHNFVIIVVVLVVFGVQKFWNILLFFPALILWWLNGMWLSFVLGIISARFRDVPPIIANVIQILFLVSPVLWTEADVPVALQQIAFVNPLSHFLRVIRDPLLGADAPAMSWGIVAAVTVVGWALAVVLLRSYRARISYWV